MRLPLRIPLKGVSVTHNAPKMKRMSAHRAIAVSAIKSQMSNS